MPAVPTARRQGRNFDNHRWHGIGDVVIDGHVRNVRRGDVAYITKGQKHSICAVTNMRLIEVELGSEIVADDIKDLEWTWS